VYVDIGVMLYRMCLYLKKKNVIIKCYMISCVWVYIT